MLLYVYGHYDPALCPSVMAALSAGGLHVCADLNEMEVETMHVISQWAF